MHYLSDIKDWGLIQKEVILYGIYVYGPILLWKLPPYR